MIFFVVVVLGLNENIWNQQFQFFKILKDELILALFYSKPQKQFLKPKSWRKWRIGVRKQLHLSLLSTVVII